MNQIQEERADALLSALAAQVRAEDAEVAALLDADLPPISPAHAERMFAAAYTALGADGTAAQAPDERAGATVVQLATRRRRVWWGAGIAAAAAIVAMLVWPSTPDGLPAYSLSAGAGEQLQRGNIVQAERARYSPGARVTLVAQPAVEATGVEARVYLRNAGTLTRLAVPVQIGARGAVRLDAIAGESLPLPEGDSTLIILVRPSSSTTSDANFLSAENPAPARVLTHSLSFSSASR